MDAVNYLEGRSRMTSKCLLGCGFCPLSCKNNGTSEMCYEFEMNHPAEAVRIVEEWSKAHPTPTNGQKFVEVFGFEPTMYDKTGEEIHDYIADPNWWHEAYEAPKGDNNG